MEAFLFLHGIGHSRYKSLHRHFDLAGIFPRVHGNTKRLPSNTSSQEHVDRVLAFIDTTANVHGLPLPGRMPNHRDSDVILLPSILPKGLELERQWYLYEKICPLCHTNLARDLTCPKPTLPKPHGAKKKNMVTPTTVSCASAMEEDHSGIVLAGTKRRLCSVCHNPGHNKKTCPNKD